MLGENIYRLWSKSPRANLNAIRRKMLSENHSDDTQVFFLSTGRVGSQTLSELLACSAKITALHEPAPLLAELSKIAYSIDYKENLDAIILAAIRGMRGEMVKEYQPGVYCETSPHSTFLAPYINRVFHNARFVHVVRHPFDVIKSGMIRGWYSGDESSSSRIEPFNSETVRSWSKMNQLEKNAWSWNNTNQWIEKYFKTENLIQIRIRAEDVFQADKDTLHQLFQFVKRPVPKRYKLETVLKLKLNATENLSQGREFTKQEKETILRWCGDLMGKYGYNT